MSTLVLSCLFTNLLFTRSFWSQKLVKTEAEVCIEFTRYPSLICLPKQPWLWPADSPVSRVPTRLQPGQPPNIGKNGVIKYWWFTWFTEFLHQRTWVSCLLWSPRNHSDLSMCKSTYSLQYLSSQVGQMSYLSRSNQKKQFKWSKPTCRKNTRTGSWSLQV